MRSWHCWGIAALLVAGCGRVPIPETTEIESHGLVDSRSVASQLPPPFSNPGDWSGWLGPQRNACALTASAPVNWSATNNVVWKSRLPGHGHASPIVLGDRIFLATADNAEQVQSVLAISRQNGQWIWQTDVLRGQFETTIHAENSQASSTLATDGERLFATFLNDRRIWCSALSLDGEELWRQEVGGFRSRFGYSASPLVFQSVVIIAADHEDGGFLAALDRGTGNLVWRRKRPAVASYASPGLVNLNGTPLVVLSGGGKVSAYDPRTGNEVWSVAGTTESTVGTPIVSEDLMILSGGYPDAQTLALDAKGQKVWSTKDRCYVTTPLVVDRLLFLMQDDGILKCLESQSGKELWKHRIGGKFRASPLCVDNRVYVTDMGGRTTVFAVSASRFEQLAQNQLGTECFASPAVSQGQLLLRIADDSRGVREEWLYCLQERLPSNTGDLPGGVSRPTPREN